MLATKKLRVHELVVLLPTLIACIISGCTPPAQRAALEGDKALAEGKLPRAIEKLKEATAHEPTEPRIWNLLGVAYHRSGEPQLAEQAYRQALARDRSNVVDVAHFNLGCLLLEQNSLSAAADELRSYTLVTNSALAWTKLGTAQLKQRQLDAAERSFLTALRFEPKNIEALNGVGVVQAYRNRALQALQYFNAALQVNSKYAPAVLNSGVMAHQTPSTRHIALQRYREFLSLHPRSAATEAVADVAQRLAHDLAPAPPPAVAVAATNQMIPAPSSLPAAVASRPPALTLRSNGLVTIPANATNIPPAPFPSRSAEPAMATLPAAERNIVTEAPAAGSPVVMTNPPARIAKMTNVDSGLKTLREEAPPPVTVVTISTQETVPMAQPVPTATAPARPSVASQSGTSIVAGIEATKEEPETEDTPAPAVSSRQGFLTRLNPFRNRSQAVVRETNRTIVVARPPPSEALETVRIPSSFPPYAFLNPPQPPSGDRPAAERALEIGIRSQEKGETNGAMTAYREAIRADPGFFEANYNLALLMLRSGDVQGALRQCEAALAIRPESVNARYHFALALKEANHLPDAARELNKIVEAKPEDARAHLLLANLYAQPLGDSRKAREHYLKLLELEPRNPQAPAIRFWLAANP